MVTFSVYLNRLVFVKKSVNGPACQKMRSLLIVNISVFNTNSVDSDQTPRSVASDLGLHCFSFPFNVTRHNWVQKLI